MSHTENGLGYRISYPDEWGKHRAPTADSVVTVVVVAVVHATAVGMLYYDIHSNSGQ